MENRSYEEIYADFLHACEGRGLSERELEVAWLLYRGHTNRQIGEELFIAETTVNGEEACVAYLREDGCMQQERISREGAGRCTFKQAFRRKEMSRH